MRDAMWKDLDVLFKQQKKVSSEWVKESLKMTGNILWVMSELEAPFLSEEQYMDVMVGEVTTVIDEFNAIGKEKSKWLRRKKYKL